MREAAIRGFWASTYAPFGYRKVSVQDGVIGVNYYCRCASIILAG